MYTQVCSFHSNHSKVIRQISDKLFPIELQEQKIMLDQLDTDMDKADEKMNVVLEKLGKLLKTKNNCQLCTIIILTLILIILSKLIISPSFKNLLI